MCIALFMFSSCVYGFKLHLNWNLEDVHDCGVKYIALPFDLVACDVFFRTFNISEKILKSFWH